MGKLRFALIGCGRISKNHITAIATNAEVMELVAVCDPIEACAKKQADSYLEQSGKTAAIYTDYKKALDELDIDCCAIATESGYHGRKLPWTAFEKASTF